MDRFPAFREPRMACPAARLITKTTAKSAAKRAAPSKVQNVLWLCDALALRYNRIDAGLLKRWYTLLAKRSGFNKQVDVEQS